MSGRYKNCLFLSNVKFLEINCLRMYICFPIELFNKELFLLSFFSFVLLYKNYIFCCINANFFLELGIWFWRRPSDCHCKFTHFENFGVKSLIYHHGRQSFYCLGRLIDLRMFPTFVFDFLSDIRNRLVFCSNFYYI